MNKITLYFWHLIATAMLGLCLLLLMSCANVGTSASAIIPPAPPSPPAPSVSELPPPADETPADRQSRELRDLAAYHKGEQERAMNLLQAAEKAKIKAEQAARLAPVFAVITWATWLGFLAGLVGVALLVALTFWSIPIGKGTAYALIVGGPAVALTAQGLGLVLPWLAIAGLIILGLGVAVLIYLLLRKWSLAHATLARSYERTAAALGNYNSKLRSELDMESLKEQVLLRVDHINDRALKVAPAVNDG